VNNEGEDVNKKPRSRRNIALLGTDRGRGGIIINFRAGPYNF